MDIHAGLHPLACRDCGGEVLVRKNSPTHTSIQWTLAAVAECTELGADSPLAPGCPRLRASIEAAVRDGTLEVAA